MSAETFLDGRVTLHGGDCLAVLKTLPEASVDAIVTDPPYEQTSLKWDRWPREWLLAVRRVLKPTGSMWVFGSLRMFFEKRDEFAGWRLAEDIVWEKHNGSSFHADRFKRVHEQAVHFYRDDAPWADVYREVPKTPDAVAKAVRRKRRPTHTGGIRESVFVSEDGGPRIMRSVIYHPSCHGFAIHPTQKPEAILEPLILNSCPPGGVVLDPFAGSGSTGAAAARIGRSAILIEADPAYRAAAGARLVPGPLFAGAAA